MTARASTLRLQADVGAESINSFSGDELNEDAYF
jgi:hypothetical protein